MFIISMFLSLFGKFFKLILFIVLLCVAWHFMGTVWTWFIGWAALTVMLFKWGPGSMAQTGKRPWTILGTRGHWLYAPLIALVAPVVLAAAWPIVVLMLVVFGRAAPGQAQGQAGGQP